MKVICLLLFCLVSVHLGFAQDDIGIIDWTVITPIHQVPSFFQRFPFLRLIFDIISPPTNVGNNNEAPRTAYPYTVGLIFHFNDGNGFCGGSLISNNWTLTAAHCASGAFSGIAIIGAHNIRNSQEIGQERYFVDEIIIHPGWDSERLVHDIALAKLPQSITYNQFIQPIRLPNVRQIASSWVNQQGTLSGWGTNLFDYNSGIFLGYTENHVITNLLCFLSFPTLIEYLHLCSVGDAASLSACPGESGSPYVVHEADGNPTQIGVTSFISGLGCERGRPSVFARLPLYLSWIEIATDFEVPVRDDFDF